MRWDDFVELVQMPSSLIIQIRGAYSEAKMHPPGWLGFANDERMSFVFLKMQFCYCSECLLNFLCPHDFVTFLPRSFAAISRGQMVEAVSYLSGGCRLHLQNSLSIATIRDLTDSTLNIPQ